MNVTSGLSRPIACTSSPRLGASWSVSTRRRPGGSRAREAFTLVEVLVTVALLGIVMVLLLVPLVNSFGYFRSATARGDAQAAARICLDSMARELADAMYVQLDMYDESMIAFVPPLRLDPDDPNSDIVTPPRPDWSRAIRYWQALYDPTRNYNPGTYLGPGNTYFVARTVVPDPLNYPDSYDDPWNRWSQDWADEQNDQAAEGITNWSPISRIVHTDIDWQFTGNDFGLRNATLQPGFPYLDVQYQLSEGTITEAEATRAYRDYVVGLTPNALDYDASHLEFAPAVVAGEWLRPLTGPNGVDYSVYRSRHPLWRLGAPYTGWASFAEDQQLLGFLDTLYWARDPFLLIHRWEPEQQRYLLRAAGVFDPRTRFMRVMNLGATGGEPAAIYDTAEYPYVSPTAWIAFGIDWIDGSLHCALPPWGDRASMQAELPYAVGPGTLVSVSALPEGQLKYDMGLPPWAARTVDGSAFSAFILPDSVEVYADSFTGGVSTGLPDRLLTQVECTPREGMDQFQLGADPSAAASTHGPHYGWLRFPQVLGDGVDADLHTFWIDYRWRNNGYWENGVEYPDLISAYYRTAAIIDISLTVTRADPSARAGQRISQSANMSRRVKLRNLVREIRHAED